MSEEDKLKGINRQFRSLAEEAMKDQSIAYDYSEDNTANNSYSIGNIIAVGGLKEIRIARDRRSGRHVAMAQLKSENLTPKNRERFLREARILSNLEHGNIVPLYEINYDSEHRLFFTMKLLSGETLASILKKVKNGNDEYRKKYTIAYLLGIFLRVCDAIKFAHSKNIVHLDLKPENIQISEFGEVSVIDWGMAKYISDKKPSSYLESDIPSFIPLTHKVNLDKDEDDLPGFIPLSSNMTKSGTVSGTPGFMSPEQADNTDKEITIPSDIYSLGATLYALLYREAPYQGIESNKVIEYTKEGKKLEYPQSSNGINTPNALRAIIEKAMQLKSNMRYDSVQDLQDDINLYLNDFATKAEDINLIKLSQLFLKRQQKSIAVFSLIIVIASVILTVSYSEISKQTEIAEQQNIKVQATADEIITGMIEKHKQLRNQFAFDEMLTNYEKLRNLGYNFPEFWYNEGRLYAGELNFKKAHYCFQQAEKHDTDLVKDNSFQKSFFHIKQALNISEERELTHKEILIFAINMDNKTQAQIFWNLNRDEKISIKERLNRFGEAVRFYNQDIPPKSFFYEYTLKNAYITVDLSNNPLMKQIIPIVGLPINELRLINNRLNLGSTIHHIKKTVDVLDISGSEITFPPPFIKDSNFRKLIARNTHYSAFDLSLSSKLKHLDVSGSRILGGYLTRASKQLEYLDISFSDFSYFDILPDCTKLKTLVIDSSIIIPRSIRKELEANKVQIISHQKNIFKIPGIIEAENYSRMSGISTENTLDIGGGKNAGWIDKDDYISYAVDVEKAGKYKVTFRIAGFNFNFDLKSEGEALCSIAEIGTGEWQTWISKEKEITIQEAGNTELTIHALASGLNINWIKFEYLGKLK